MISSAQPIPTTKKYTVIFWLLLVPYVCLGTFVPSWTQWCYRTDLLEQTLIGREWVWGSHKHPALTTWIIDIFWRLLGKQNFVPYFASMVCIGVAIYALWKLARDYLPEKQALFASLVLMAYWYFNAGAAMYNNNVTMILFWSLSLLFFHRSLQTKNPIYWSFLGLFLGAALLCKYTSIFLVATIFLFLVLPKKNRIYWYTPGPYLAFSLAFFVFLPHLLFLRQHWDNISGYVASKKPAVDYGQFLLLLVQGWFLQLVIITPVVLSLFPLLKLPIRRSVKPRKGDYTDIYIQWFFLTPIILLVIAQLLLKIPFSNRQYGFHLWPVLGIVILSTFELNLTAKRWKQAVSLTVFFSLAQMLSLVVLFVYSSYFSAVSSERHYPGREISSQIDALWAERLPERNCPIVAAKDEILAWYYGVYSGYNPRLLSPDLGGWLRDDDLNQQGGVVLWNALDDSEEIPDSLLKRFPAAEKIGTVSAKYRQRNEAIPKVKVGVAIVPYIVKITY